MNIVTLAECKERFLKICREQIDRPGLDGLIDWLEKSDYNIVGADIIRNQLNIAYEGQKISKVRHILKS